MKLAERVARLGAETAFAVSGIGGEEIRVGLGLLKEWVESGDGA